MQSSVEDFFQLKIKRKQRFQVWWQFQHFEIWHEPDINLDLNSNIAQSKYFSYHLLHPIQQVRNKNVKLSKCFRYWIYCIHFQIQDSSQDWDLVCHKTNVVHSVPSEYSYFFSQLMWNHLIMGWFAVSNCRIFEILRNIYLFSSSCLGPVGCLSFVRWKKSK